MVLFIIKFSKFDDKEGAGGDEGDEGDEGDKGDKEINKTPNSCTDAIHRVSPNAQCPTIILYF
ncbi:hypothetical protein [Nostoc sp. NMS4]|uniref:hypothetical protein n=1 Tax=Nostoc sp. NMS4 TaxID=2815390 RepID=UPI0025EC2563|nr:hypothetical protein [Nostoc sp. NMS4]MBN3924108.1 hypothetical protein [Nostoc sp. NMS4]